MSNQKSIFKIIITLVILSLMLGNITPAQAEAVARPMLAGGNLVWAKNLGGASFETGHDITLDSNGNIVTTGGFFETADFDPGTGTFNLTSAGINDIFISKLDDGGNFIWAASMGSVLNDEVWGVITDSNNNVYTTGYFQDTAEFDPGPNTFSLASVGGTDVFISKLDKDGNFVWAKSIGGISNEISFSIGIDSNNNIYITGVFVGTADFDPGPNTLNLTSAGGGDVFISKLDENGNLIWAKILGGVNDDYGNAIAIDTNSNIYVTGTYRGTVDFDPNTGILNLTSTGSYNNTFITKLDGNGNFAWAKSIGGTDQVASADIVPDLFGNVYTMGYFAGSADFDPSANTFTLNQIGNNDMFISKLNNMGEFVWAKQISGTTGQDVSGYDIAVDAIGSVYTTGAFFGTADFDPGSGTYNLTSANGLGAFISKLASNGEFVLAKSMSGTGGATNTAVALDSLGNIHTTGNFDGTVDFEPGSGTFNLTSMGKLDVFVSKLDNSPTFFDVPFHHWAGGYIERLFRGGITGGCSTSPLMYCPDATVTRAQMAIFILRGIHGSSYTPPTATGMVFTDVPASYWAVNWIEQLAAEGITGGCGGGNYCPDATITRAQMAIFLLRGEHGSAYTPPTATGAIFTDVPLGSFADAWIEQLALEGVTAGCGGGNYCPDSSVTRAEMAVFLVRAFGLP